MPTRTDAPVPRAPSAAAPGGTPNPRRHRRHGHVADRPGAESQQRGRRGSVAAMIAKGSIDTMQMTTDIRGKRIRRSSTGSFKDKMDQPRPMRSDGTVWIGQVPDYYVDKELSLSKAFERFGKVLSCTVRQKTGHLRNWALLTFVHPSAVSDAVRAAIQGEVTLEDSDGSQHAVVVRKAKVDAELRRNNTGALAGIWEMQNDKIAAAVRIQKTVRGRQARKKSKHATDNVRPSKVAAWADEESTQSGNTATVWSPQVTQLVQIHWHELANYMQWMRCEREASGPVVGRRDEILSEMRRAMRAPSRSQLLAAAGMFVALLVVCLVLVGILAGTMWDLEAEKEESARQQGIATATAKNVRSAATGVGRCLASTISSSNDGFVSTTEMVVSASFQLTVTVSSIDPVQCAGATTVNRVVFTDYATEFSKVVSCVPSTSSPTPPTGLSVADRPLHTDDVAYVYHTSTCNVAADVLPLGNYDVQLVHVANAVAGPTTFASAFPCCLSCS